MSECPSAAADRYNRELDAQADAEMAAPTFTDIFAIVADKVQTAGVIHFATGWHVYFNGEISAETYADRTAAIDELAKRDRAAKFCEAQG